MCAFSSKKKKKGLCLLLRESVWPSGKALGLVSRRTSVQFRFGSQSLFKRMVCGHCHMTLSLAFTETSLKWLSSLPIIMA